VIDYTKANVDPSAFADSVLASLDWKVKVNQRTGETSPWKVYEFGSMKLEAYESDSGEIRRVILSGSIHKHAQEGANWMRFDYAQLSQTVIDLCHYLQISPHQIRLENLEAGANVVTPYKADQVLAGAFLHRTNPFESLLRDRRIGVVAEKHDFRDKLYAKGHQFSEAITRSNWQHIHPPENLIRWERHYTKMREVNSFGIETFADLLNPSKLASLCSHIEHTLEEVLFIPQAPEAQSEIRSWHRDWTNPRYFERLTKSNPQKFRRERAELRKRLEASNFNVWGEVTHAIREELRSACWPSKNELAVVDYWLNSMG
jgi:hypothetical protein